MGACCVAARFRRRGDTLALFRGHIGLGAGVLQIGAWGLGFGMQRDQCGRIAGGGEILGHDQSDRLAAIQDSVVQQRPERMAGRGDRILIGFVTARRQRPVLVRIDPHHARHGLGGGGVDANEPALGDRAGHDIADQQARDVILGGIFRCAGDF